MGAMKNRFQELVDRVGYVRAISYLMPHLEPRRTLEETRELIERETGVSMSLSTLHKHIAETKGELTKAS